MFDDTPAPRVRYPRDRSADVSGGMSGRLRAAVSDERRAV
jgi:hypothetical protein